MKNTSNWWKCLLHLGVQNDSSYLLIKRIHMVNIICIMCVLPSFVFTGLNILEQRWILATINFLTGICYIVVLYLQYFKRINLAKAVLLGSSFILFFTSGLLYRNGGEYFLLSVLVVSMLLYDNIKGLCLWGTTIILGILIIYAAPTINWHETPVEKSRAIYNVMCSLVFCITAIVFFKRVIYKDKQLIEEQRVHLEKMNREKEKIFSIIAHDMRAPLINTSIIIDIFESNTTNKNHLNDFIGQLKKQINDQNKVLEHILTWASNNMKGVTTVRSQVFIADLIENIFEEYKIHYLRKGITIHLQVNRSSCVFANYDHLMIIFRNLISNAIKFSYQDGEIYVSTTEDSDRIFVHIQDHGIGIDLDKSKVLFTQVQQRSIGTSNESGSGLGLMLCKELIEINDGTIQIESAKNAGSTFSVSFPKFISNTLNTNTEQDEVLQLEMSEA